MENIKVIKSDRRTASVEISRDLTVTVRVPRRFTRAQTEAFIARNSEWIAKHLELQRRRGETLRFPVDTDPAFLRAEAERTIPPLVAKYSALTGLKPKAVRYSSAKKRLGSCSPDGTVRFSYTLMLYPLDAVEYVVLHELAHLKERNHQRGFYALIERYMPDWRRRRAMLKG